MPGTLTVDLDAVAANWRILSAEHAKGPVAAVVKADAYGLGARRVAARLLAEGCGTFFVATAHEAQDLAAAVPGRSICVLHGLGGDPRPFVAGGFTPVLSTLEDVQLWSTAAAFAAGGPGSRGLPAILHIETGLNRLALDAFDIADIQADPSLLGRIDVVYLMTHLASAERPDDPMNAAQLARFAAACAGLPAAPRSVANSSGVFLPGAASALARPGAALYGLNPTPGRPNPMRNVVTLRAPILSVREIGPGETVGYNATWTAQRPTAIATVEAGYADGWTRALSNRGAAFFDGQRVPLVGRVSMDLSTYDVTDAPRAAPGAELELIGPLCPPDAVAEAFGGSGYEVLTSLGRRYARRYVGQ